MWTFTILKHFDSCFFYSWKAWLILRKSDLVKSQQIMPLHLSVIISEEFHFGDLSSHFTRQKFLSPKIFLPLHPLIFLPCHLQSFFCHINSKTMLPTHKYCIHPFDHDIATFLLEFPYHSIVPNRHNRLYCSFLHTNIFCHSIYQRNFKPSIKWFLPPHQ